MEVWSKLHAIITVEDNPIGEMDVHKDSVKASRVLGPTFGW